MNVRDEFNDWATDGRDRGMADRHWNTAKRALRRMPLENGDAVLDLGCGSGYSLRALRGGTAVDCGIGLDGTPAMVRNTRSYAEDPSIEYLVGTFGSLPFAGDAIDHCWSMEAFYSAGGPHQTLREPRRVLRPGGTFYCAVNYYEENVHTYDWQEDIEVKMTRWSEADDRAAFREAGFDLATQDNIPDHEVELPAPDAFQYDGWETRESMVERYREFGTLLTVGVVP